MQTNADKEEQSSLTFSVYTWSFTCLWNLSDRHKLFCFQPL